MKHKKFPTLKELFGARMARTIEFAQKPVYRDSPPELMTLAGEPVGVGFNVAGRRYVIDFQASDYAGAFKKMDHRGVTTAAPHEAAQMLRVVEARLPEAQRAAAALPLAVAKGMARAAGRPPRPRG